MSTSILYHVFGLKGIEYKSTRYFADILICSVEMKKQILRCPGCGYRQTIFKGQKRRWFQMRPMYFEGP